MNILAKFKKQLTLERCQEPAALPRPTDNVPDNLKQRFLLSDEFWLPSLTVSGKLAVGRPTPSEDHEADSLREVVEPLVVAATRREPTRHIYLDDLLWFDGSALRPIEGLKRKKGKLVGAPSSWSVDWQPRGLRLLTCRRPSWVYVADMSYAAPRFEEIFFARDEGGQLEGARWLADQCVAVSCNSLLSIISVEREEPEILQCAKKRRGFALVVCDGRVVVTPGELLAWAGGRLTKLASMKKLSSKTGQFFGFDPMRCSFFTRDRLIFKHVVRVGVAEYYELRGMNEVLVRLGEG